MVLLLVVIAFRPAVGGSAPGVSATGGLEVYFVVDTTTSMAAEDYGAAAPRLDGVRSDISGLARSLPGAEYSLITFDSSAIERMPLTTDLSALRSVVTALTQEVSSYSAGSSIDAPIELLERTLAEAEKSHPDRPRVVYYFGDGEQTVAEAPRSFEPLAKYLTGGAVLGYGTAEGGRMTAFDGYNDSYSEQTHIQDYSTSPPTDAISRIDETTLGTIATELGVGYAHRAAGAAVDPLVAGITVDTPRTSQDQGTAPFELYWLAAVPLVLLLLREALATGGALRESAPGRRSR
jgi:Ca-activated chloride channel family protein